jgi:hypothetical protein
VQIHTTILHPPLNTSDNSIDADESVEDLLARADGDAVHEALLREAARKIEWQVGDEINIDTEDGVEKGVIILGPAADGDDTQMRVKFPDGTIDDWDKEDFIVPESTPRKGDTSPTGRAAAVALQQELLKSGTSDVEKIDRLRRASMQGDDSAT